MADGLLSSDRLLRQCVMKAKQDDCDTKKT